MDNNYWENFYSKQNAELKPSLFAVYVNGLMNDNRKNIIELGCGNGRDSIFFANNNHNVLAIDQCKTEIAFLQNHYKQVENLIFRCDDFTSLKTDNSYDIVYSRFTLHSINKVEEQRVLKWAYNCLNTNGLFCIEVRGQRNEIYKLGKAVENEQDAFVYNDHYRRFLNFDILCSDLRNLGFDLIFAAEDKDFAPFNGENETYIRVIAKK